MCMFPFHMGDIFDKILLIFTAPKGKDGQKINNNNNTHSINIHRSTYNLFN